MRYVPTVTRRWRHLDLKGASEVLLTPSEYDRGSLPEEPSTIIIDNGGWIINTRKPEPDAVEQRVLKHIELCKDLKWDPRCVFILPDIRWSPILNRWALQAFMDQITPLRFALVDCKHILLDFPHLVDLAEFLCIPARNVEQRSFPDLGRYHLLGRLDGKPAARSWDDSLFDTRKALSSVILKRSY